MHLTDKQAAVVQKLLNNFQDFLRLYGDDESEELMRWLSSSFKIDNPIITPLRFIVRFTDKSQANIVNDYFRSDNFIRVDKHCVVVEMVTMSKLDGISTQRLQSIFDSASILEEVGQRDLDGAVNAVQELIIKGATLVSITPTAAQEQG